MNAIEIRPRASMVSGALLGVVLTALLGAQPQVQFGAFYACPNATRFKVLSCAGNDANSKCEVEPLREHSRCRMDRRLVHR